MPNEIREAGVRCVSTHAGICARGVIPFSTAMLITLACVIEVWLDFDSSDYKWKIWSVALEWYQDDDLKGGSTGRGLTELFPVMMARSQKGIIRLIALSVVFLQHPCQVISSEH